LLFTLPDVGGVARARALAKKSQMMHRLAFIDKRQSGHSGRSALNVIETLKVKQRC